MEKELAQINRKIERDEHAEELKRIEKETRGIKYLRTCELMLNLFFYNSSLV